MRVVSLISGNGTNLQALINCQNKGLLGNAQLIGVISNVDNAFGLERASHAAIRTSTLPHTQFVDRLSFDLALIEVIREYDPDLIALSGFMRILTVDFVTYFANKLINIHPSLLPKYKGLHTHRRAIEAGERTSGATVHWVAEKLDSGSIIRQIKVPILPEDTEKTLKARVLKAEHKLYPAVVRDLSLEVS
jgi:phosphoribosylglycinamide formyltransferase-1